MTAAAVGCVSGPDSGLVLARLTALRAVAAVSVPSACAIFERTFETWSDSTPPPVALPELSL